MLVFFTLINASTEKKRNFIVTYYFINLLLRSGKLSLEVLPSRLSDSHGWRTHSVSSVSPSPFLIVPAACQSTK